MQYDFTTPIKNGYVVDGASHGKDIDVASRTV